MSLEERERNAIWYQGYYEGRTKSRPCRLPRTRMGFRFLFRGPYKRWHWKRLITSGRLFDFRSRDHS